MRKITVIDSTLCRNDKEFTFKEKLEIAKQLDKLGVDVIELPQLQDEKVDLLFVKTLLGLLGHAKLSVPFGKLKDAFGDRKDYVLRLEVPVSTLTMEYLFQKKPQDVLSYIKTSLDEMKSCAETIEFCAIDATRADESFLKEVVSEAFSKEVSFVTICDSASTVLPDEYLSLTEKTAFEYKSKLAVCAYNKINTANATSAMAVKNGFNFVKTQINGEITPLMEFCEFLRENGNKYLLESNIEYSKLYKTVNNISQIDSPQQNEKIKFDIKDDSQIESKIILDVNDDETVVGEAIESLGYDLSNEDKLKVFNEVKKVVKNKNVGAVELDAIIAGVALQAPSVYKVKNYVITSVSSFSSNAQITVEKEDKEYVGLASGNGPIDAAFLALDNIVGKRYELDDFQIKSVTKGKEAIGVTLVKLRSDGKLYSGKGVSTDIIGASIMAYINAVNKIMYEES